MDIRVKKILRNMFELDYRSLALLRMGLGTLILCVLYVSIWDLRGLYTDEGVLPRSMLLSNYGSVFSLHMAGSSVGFEAVMFAAQSALALLMIVGYRTRIVTIASYILLVSLQARNPLLNFGIDTTLRVCFFWAMFLPLNRRYSLDVAIGRVRLPETATYFRISGMAYLVQFSLIYLFSGVLKSGPTWKVDYTAVSYALSLEVFRRPLGAWLNQHDALTTWLTILTPYVEIYAPLLLILPVWSGWGRIVAFAVFAALQVGFNVCMQMGLFGPVMIVVSFALLPGEFWTYFAEPAGRRLRRVLSQWRGTAALPGRLADGLSRWLDRRRLAEGLLQSGISWPRLRGFVRGVSDAVALFLIVYVVVWNLDGIPGNPRRIPAKYTWIATTTGLDQFFNFFTPNPQTDDGWFVIVGELKSGQRVNAFTGESTVTFDRPANVYSSSYIDQRWGSFLICLWSPDYSAYLEPFSRYLAREWNRRHNDEEQMKSVEISFMHEVIGRGHTRTPVAQEVLWTQTF